MTALRIKPAGSTALLACLEHPDQVTGLYRELQTSPPAGYVDAIPAAETVMVVYDPARTQAATLAAWLESALDRPVTAESAPHQGPAISIPVTYDGPDLSDVAARTNLSADEVLRRHTSAEYVVTFCGFAPGFAYLSGLDPALCLPRRTVPRTRIPAGSVAIADRYTSVYPSNSPGGWHLLGRTETVMWDLDRQSPALLTPGTRVRFEAL
ncbi:MAG TPA: allophanate hydrolase subunit 1 [Actinospica sp.]|nr:allophanate hydrolase subunit 1 [Actinospica sp.]